MLRPPTPRPTRALPRRALSAGGRLLLLLVALGGLFAMHGLADHGVAGHLVTSSASHAGAVGHVEDHPSGTAGHAPTAHVAHGAPQGLDAGASSVTVSRAADALEAVSSGAGHGHMTELCLAILAAALVLALSAVPRRTPWSAAFASSVRPVLVARARDPVPPDLRRLSVQRC